MVQTRRDQLQAYRFQNRRALAALVTGEPNVLEPPMRRLTVTTMSGIMIAILVAVGFLLVGLIKPSGNTDWESSGAVVVEKQTGATYVVLAGVLHPVLNYTSAVLAVAGSQKAHTVLVDRSDLDGARRGATIGIPDIPATLPSASGPDHVVLDRVLPAQAGRREPARDRRVRHRRRRGRRVAPAVLGRGRGLTAGANAHRLPAVRRNATAIASPVVAAALHLENAPSLTVGAAFLNAVPAGPPLAVPKVARRRHAVRPHGGRAPGAGRPAAAGVRPGRHYLVLSDGVVAVNAVEAALLRTVPLAGGALAAPVDVSETDALAQPKSGSAPAALAQFAGLPLTLPAPTAVAAQSGGHGGLCAIYPHGATSPRFGVPASELPSFSSGTRWSPRPPRRLRRRGRTSPRAAPPLRPRHGGCDRLRGGRARTPLSRCRRPRCSPGSATRVRRRAPSRPGCYRSCGPGARSTRPPPAPPSPRTDPSALTHAIKSAITADNRFVSAISTVVR